MLILILKHLVLGLALNHLVLILMVMLLRLVLILLVLGILLGNSVTSTDFIGTTNNQDIRFKRENVNIGRVALGSVFFGSNNWFTSYW
jgi:hypothetical protein